MPLPRTTHGVRPAALPLAACCLLALAGCQGVAKDGHLVLPETCVLMPTDLLGTWVVQDAARTLTCPAGVPLSTSSATSSFGPVTGAVDPTIPGYRITAPGLTVRLEESCRITWTWQDRNVARFDCFGIYDPATRTVGTTAPGQCNQVTRLNANGSAGATCAIPAPFLDVVVSVR